MKFFAQIMTLYLVLGSFLPRTDFSQLLTLSDLKSHFDLHAQEAALTGVEVSMCKFLWNHFVDPGSHSSSHGENQHKDLPFHSFQVQFFASLSPVQSPEHHAINLNVFTSSVYKNELHLTGCLSILDRPPAS